MRQYQQRQKSVHVGQNFAFYYLNFFYSWKVLIVWYVFLTEIRIILTVCPEMSCTRFRVNLQSIVA